MTDPVSLVASCLGIASGITKLIDSISSFVSNVQEARRDMNDVQKELDAVRTILLELRDKGQDLGFGQVPSLKTHVFEVVSNCGNVVADMKKLLRTMRNGSMRWVTSGKKQMAKLKLNLEAHKSTLSIALELWTGLITTDIARDTRSIKGGTEKMLEEIRFLQAQVTSLDMQQESKLAIQSFLVESVARANSDCSVAEDPQTYWTSLPQQQRDQLLLKACLDGNLKRLELLLRSGANIDARDEAGNTPLLLVIRNQHRHCLPLLFENGASPNDKSAGQFFGGKSAFDIAMDLGDTATAEILFRHGVYDPQSIARYSQVRLRLRGDLPPTQKTSVTTNATSHSSSVPLEEAQFRTWTDQSTSFTLEGEFISLNQGRVTLRRRNGGQIIIPIAKISHQDQDYIGRVLGVALEIDRSPDTGSPPTNKDATASSGEDVSASPQLEQIPGYEYWFLFFCTCGIPIKRSESYAQKFIEKSIDKSILPIDAQFWGSHELLYEDVIKIMSYLDTYCAEVPRSSVRDAAGKDFDPPRGQARTRWKQNSPQVVQQNPLPPAIKIGPSSPRREGERGRSQSAPPPRQPMRFPLPRSRGASPWREFEQEYDTRDRLYRRATWEDNDRGRRSRAYSWDEPDIMARSRSRSCSLPDRYARRRVSQGRNMRIRSRSVGIRSRSVGVRSRSVGIRSRTRSNWDGGEVNVEISRSGWDGGEVDIEIGRSGGGRRGIWRRARGEDLDDLGPYLLERTRERRVAYSRGRYYYEGRVIYRGRRWDRL